MTVDLPFHGPRIAVVCGVSDARVRASARSLADELGLPMLDQPAAAAVAFELLLVAGAQRLELREAFSKTSATGPTPATGPIYVDFVGGRLGHRARSIGHQRQLIARAIGSCEGPITVVDATAGLSRDAFVLACLGCTVLAVERSPVLGALVRDGLTRAGQRHDERLDAILRRMTLVVADSREVLAKMRGSSAPDIVYLDPIYPRRTKSALAKKESRICRRLVGDDPDAGELLAIASSVARRRVVVKRHPQAPPLAPCPTWQVIGTRVRFDVYQHSDEAARSASATKNEVPAPAHNRRRGRSPVIGQSREQRSRKHTQC